MFGWLQERHRRQILERTFPESWNAIPARNVAHWKFLDDAERVHLRSLIQVFVAEKQWDGCGGPALTDEIQVTIAGLACLLLLGLDHMLYSNVRTICVYPSTVVAPGERSVDSNGITMQESAVPIYGQSILPTSWTCSTVVSTARRPLLSERSMSAGSRCVRASTTCAPLRLEGKAHARGWLRCHQSGGIFAVVTECFFDKPLQMKRQHLELYSLLQEFYRQDPAAREARHSHGFASAHTAASAPA
jgi:Mlc titration factor MtfA (ptsG expression regulator)